MSELIEFKYESLSGTKDIQMTAGWENGYGKDFYRVDYIIVMI